jgi:hypothetical protein
MRKSAEKRKSIKDHPCKHVVSFRVNEEEKRVISKLASKAGLSTSSVMRAIFVDNIHELAEAKLKEY